MKENFRQQIIISLHLWIMMHFNIHQKKHRRTMAHPNQFQNRTTSSIIYDTNNNNYYYCIHDKNIKNNRKKFNGLILSDSMCQHVRIEKLNSKEIHVKLSYESGSTCCRMMQFLEQQAKINGNDIFQANFIVYSLCTNDVANMGAVAAIKQCRELIKRARELFPTLKAIGWIALSPRYKPSRLHNAEEIGTYYHQLNQLLAELGKEMNFDIIYANLPPQHLYIDGLHALISSRRNLIENALLNWFNKKNIITLNNPILNNNNNKSIQPSTTTTYTYTNKNRPYTLKFYHNNNNNNMHNNNNN